MKRSDLVSRVLTACENRNLLLVEHSHLLYLINRYASDEGKELLFKKVRSALLDLTVVHPNKIQPKLFLAETSLALGIREEFCYWVKQIECASYSSKRMRSVFEVRRNILRKPIDYEIKVFGIGLSKTGTTSLDFYLNQIGIHATHFTNIHTRDLLQESDFTLFSGFSDITISWQFEKIYSLFPKAKFIYTTRHLDSWNHSISQHYQRSMGISKPSQLNGSHSGKIYQGRLIAVHNNLYTPYNSWKSAYETYDQRVHQFFKDKSANQLLKIDLINDPESHIKVAEFLGKNPVGNSFPHKNRSVSYEG